MHTKNKYLLLKNVLIDVNSCSLVFQGSKGSKTMADKFVYILKNDTQNYPFCK